MSPGIDPRNRFRGGPVRQIRLSYRPASWESIPGLLKRFTNSDSGMTQTLPWWLVGEGVKTTENRKHLPRCHRGTRRPMQSRLCIILIRIPSAKKDYCVWGGGELIPVVFPIPAKTTLYLSPITSMTYAFYASYTSFKTNFQF